MHAMDLRAAKLNYMIVFYTINAEALTIIYELAMQLLCTHIMQLLTHIKWPWYGSNCLN